MLRLHPAAARPARSGMRAIDSFLVGIGLSTSCLTCMGGAVLYPLLVYAGITSWYSGDHAGTVLARYRRAHGVHFPGLLPVSVVARDAAGVHRALRTASGVILAGIALLVLSVASAS